MAEHRDIQQLAYGCENGDVETAGWIEERPVSELPSAVDLAFDRISRRDPQPRPKAIAQIGRAVMRLRLYRGWKQIDVERATGIDQTTVSRLERGTQRGLSIRRLAAILDALLVDAIVFEPFNPEGPPTSLELMLSGDRWRRAELAVERRRRRPPRTRTTISTRPSSETASQAGTVPQAGELHSHAADHRNDRHGGAPERPGAGAGR
jgi:transcriptional regulator with XRE-family HTH domain